MIVWAPPLLIHAYPPEGRDIGNSSGISYITKNTRLTGADALLFIYYAMSLTALVKREIFLPTVFL